MKKNKETNKILFSRNDYAEVDEEVNKEIFDIIEKYGATWYNTPTNKNAMVSEIHKVLEKYKIEQKYINEVQDTRSAINLTGDIHWNAAKYLNPYMEANNFTPILTQ